MKKKIVYSIIAGIAVGTIIFILNISNGPAKIYWENDARLMYRVNSRDFVHTSIPGASSMTKVLQLKGIMNVRIFSVESDVVKAAIQFSSLSITMSKKRFKNIEQIYTKPFFVDIATNGKILNFFFDNTIARDDEKNVIDTVKYAQFIVEQSISKKWQTKEKDTLGSYKAGYSLKKEKLHKRIIAYDPMVDEHGYVNKKNTINVKRSETVIEYGKPNVWFASVAGRRLLTLASEKKTYMRMSSTVEIKKIPYDPDMTLPIWNMNKEPQFYIALWKQAPKNNVSLSKKNKMISLKKHFGGISLRQLGNRLFAKYTAFDSNAVMELVKYLQLYPDKVKQLYPFLLSSRLNKIQKAMIMHALIKTGHSQAQQALSEIMTRNDFGRGVRIQAAMAFGEIDKCEERMVSELINVFNNRLNAGETGRHVASAAILSLGTISRKLGTSINDEDKQIAYEIKSKIMADLSLDNQDMQARVALIHAAGNTSQKDFIEPISIYLDSGNPRLRSTAASALKYIDDDDQVNTLLRDKLTNETNPNVKGAILTTLKDKTADSDTVDTVISSLKNEKNEIVRGHMYQYLLKNRNEPGVKKALRDMLQYETSYAHRKVINRALATRK